MSTPRRGFASRRADLPVVQARRCDGPLNTEDQEALTRLFLVIAARQLTPQDAQIARMLAGSENLTTAQAGHIMDEAQAVDEHMPDSLRPAISRLLGPPAPVPDKRQPESLDPLS